MRQVDEMTRRNAAMVEETTAISHSLAEGSTSFSAIIRRFKLNRRLMPAPASNSDRASGKWQAV